MDFALHNSLDLKYRTPFGAVCVDERLELVISLGHGLFGRCREVRLRLWCNNAEHMLGCRTKWHDDRVDCIFTAKAPRNAGLMWYYFVLDMYDGRTLYYCGTSGVGGLCEAPAQSYQITVYSRNYTTPEWFREGVLYQIFPDRFYRSRKNGLDSGLRYHQGMGRTVIPHEDWREMPVYMPLPGNKYYNPCDFYGGDLNGIAQKLPYIKSLGVNCIYLNPVFESPSNHRYNTSDYLKIDPVLGTGEDFAGLCASAGKLGIKIMLDGVFSHTGDDSVYFDKYGAYGGTGAYATPDSPYKSWYSFERYPDKYSSWWGFKSLPEINESDPGYMRFVEKVLTHWATQGATSWRLDVADELPDSFISHLRTVLKHNDPQGVLLGEVWEDASNKFSMNARREYVYGNGLDSAMGYPFRAAVLDFLLMRIDAQGIMARLLSLCENYPEPFLFAQMNLLGSHDTVRALTALANAPDRDALTREAQAQYTLTAQQHELGKKRLVLATLLQTVMPGVPCIYYGDEAGVCGMADPFNRTTYPWGDEDAELLDLTRTLMNHRASLASLKCGGYAMAAITANVFAILRMDAPETTIALINRANDAVTIALRAEDFALGPYSDVVVLNPAYKDVLSGKSYALVNGVLAVDVPGMGGELLVAVDS